MVPHYQGPGPLTGKGVHRIDLKLARGSGKNFRFTTRFDPEGQLPRSACSLFRREQISRLRWFVGGTTGKPTVLVAIPRVTSTDLVSDLVGPHRIRRFRRRRLNIASRFPMAMALFNRRARAPFSGRGEARLILVSPFQAEWTSGRCR